MISKFNTCITMIIGASNQLIIANIVTLTDPTTIMEWNKIIIMTIEVVQAVKVTDQPLNLIEILLMMILITTRADGIQP